MQNHQAKPGKLFQAAGHIFKFTPKLEELKYCGHDQCIAREAVPRLPVVDEPNWGALPVLASPDTLLGAFYDCLRPE